MIESDSKGAMKGCTKFLQWRAIAADADDVLIAHETVGPQN